MESNVAFVVVVVVVCSFSLLLFFYPTYIQSVSD